MTAASGATLVCGVVVAGAVLSLTIQHWVSLRWRLFPVTIGFPIVAIVTSFATRFAPGQDGGWPQYFPWALPMLVTAAGCVEFCRREVT